MLHSFVNAKMTSTNEIFASLIAEVLWDIVYQLCSKVSVCFSHKLLKLFQTLFEVRIGHTRDIKISQREVQSETKMTGLTL